VRACRSETRRGLRGPSARLPETLERRDDRPQPIPEVCRRQELLMAITIPAARYTSSAFAALENDRLWPRVWLLACSLDHVADPGDFHELRIGPLSVLLVRGDDLELRAFQNACRHRGSALCEGTGGGLIE